MSNPPAPPYGPNDISAPLTAQQRSTIIAWIPRAEVWSVANGWSGFTLPGNYASLSDDQLIRLYGLYYGMVSLKIPGITLNPVQAVREAGISNPLTGQEIQNPLTSVEQFLTLLTNKNLWIRVAEFAVGGAILMIGVNAVLRPGQPIHSTISNVTKKAIPL